MADDMFHQPLPACTNEGALMNTQDVSLTGYSDWQGCLTFLVSTDAKSDKNGFCLSHAAIFDQ